MYAVLVIFGLFFLAVAATGSTFNIVGIARFDGAVRSIAGRALDVALGGLLLCIGMKGVKVEEALKKQILTQDSAVPEPSFNKSATSQPSSSGAWRVNIFPEGKSDNQFEPPVPAENSGKTTQPGSSIRLVAPLVLPAQ